MKKLYLTIGRQEKMTISEFIMLRIVQIHLANGIFLKNVEPLNLD